MDIDFTVTVFVHEGGYKAGVRWGGDSVMDTEIAVAFVVNKMDIAFAVTVVVHGGRYKGCVGVIFNCDCDCVCMFDGRGVVGAFIRDPGSPSTSPPPSPSPSASTVWTVLWGEAAAPVGRWLGAAWGAGLGQRSEYSSARTI